MSAKNKANPITLKHHIMDYVEDSSNRFDHAWLGIFKQIKYWEALQKNFPMRTMWGFMFKNQAYQRCQQY